MWSFRKIWAPKNQRGTPPPHQHPKTLDRRLCTDRSGEAVVIFLFGLEAFDKRFQGPFLCCLLLPQTIDCYWLIQWSNPVSIGSHNDQTSFQSSSLYLRALGKHCYVKMSSSTLCCTVFLYNVFDQHLLYWWQPPPFPHPSGLAYRTFSCERSLHSIFQEDVLCKTIIPKQAHQERI